MVATTMGRMVRVERLEGRRREPAAAVTARDAVDVETDVLEAAEGMEVMEGSWVVTEMMVAVVAQVAAMMATAAMEMVGWLKWRKRK